MVIENYSRIYNLHKTKTDAFGGDPAYWDAPDIARGQNHRLVLEDGGINKVLFTSEKPLDDFITYFGQFKGYQFLAHGQEAEFYYGSYEKSFKQTTRFQSAVKLGDHESVLRGTDSAIQGEGIGFDVARTVVSGIAESKSFGVGTALGLLAKQAGIIQTRYFVLALSKGKTTARHQIHNQKSIRLFDNLVKGGTKSFAEIQTSLRDFGKTGKKKFGYASVDLP